MMIREDKDEEARGVNIRKIEKNVRRQMRGIDKCHLFFDDIGVKNNKERGKRIVNILVGWLPLLSHYLSAGI